MTLYMEDNVEISRFQKGTTFVTTETTYCTCDKCKTSYPIIAGQVMCNGKQIRECPYCT